MAPIKEISVIDWLKYKNFCVRGILLCKDRLWRYKMCQRCVHEALQDTEYRYSICIGDNGSLDKKDNTGVNTVIQ